MKYRMSHVIPILIGLPLWLAVTACSTPARVSTAPEQMPRAHRTAAVVEELLRPDLEELIRAYFARIPNLKSR